MKKAALLLTIFTLCASAALAQNTTSDSDSKKEDKKEEKKMNGKATINGHIIDGSTTEDMPQVTVQVFQLSDSTFMYGTVTDNEGWFNIKKVPVGEFYLRYSFMGYKTQDFNIKIVKEDRERALGVFKMYDSSYLLDEAVIEETLPPSQVVDDTLMFNVSAFRVPEGSVLEELIKRLPGVEVDEEGNITVNGKTVTRILVDGEEYFGNDRSMATKNLPVNIIHRIKTYQRKSDLARVTGIDDGEDETVMDLQIKPNMKKGWLNNFDAGIGKPMGQNDYGDWIKFLYSGRYTLNRFQQDTQFSVTANTQNSGRGNGVSQTTQVGVNFSKNIGKRFERRRNEYPLVLGGNVRWNGNRSESTNESVSQRFATDYADETFSNNDSRSNSGSNSVNGEFRMEWRPDTTIDIIFRPSFSKSWNHSSSSSRSATFNKDPYEFTSMTDILDEYRYYIDTQYGWGADYMDSIGVNSQESASRSKGSSGNMSGEFQFNKKFTEDGRNLTFRFTYSAQNGQNRNYNYSDQTYYQRHDRDTIRNRYTSNPTDNSNWSGRVMWSEPMDSGKRHLQLSYQIQVSNRNTYSSTYVLPSSPRAGEDWDERYATWSDNWYLPEDIQHFRDSALSRNGANVSRNHTVTLQYRHNTDHMNFNLGFNFMPQYTGMDNMKYLGHTIGDTSRVVYNWSPTLSYRYRWNNRTSMQATYRTNTSQPSLQDMLDIVDSISNPLNVRAGNPGLLPSLNNTFELDFQTYNDSTRRTLNIRASLTNNFRNVAQRTDYDPTTGISFSRPENMTGFWTNWNASTNITLSRTIPNTKWRYSTSGNASYRHQESYARTGSIGNYNAAAGDGSAILATTNSISAGENGSVTYRSNALEVTANGRFSYNHSVNSMRANQNTDTYNYSYGLRGNGRLPWKNINIGTDITMQSRRGYGGTYNRDDLIWNANASISFLRGNAGTLQIQYYDILNDESNVSHNVSTTGRTDTRNTSIHSYIMLHFILRVNVFGTHAARKEMRQEQAQMRGGGRGGMMGGMMGGRGGMGGPGGGFGGGGGRGR